MAGRRTLKARLKEDSRTYFAVITDFCLGFLFSSISPDGVFAPFGAAYCAVGGFAGLLGGMAADIAMLKNPLWLLIACAASFFTPRVFVLPQKTSGELQAFLAVLWSFTVTGAVRGAVDKTEARTLVTFFLCGVIGACFAYLLSIVLSCFRRGKLPSGRVCFAAFCICGSTAIAGIFHIGGRWVYVGLILSVFILCELVVRASPFYVCTLATSLGLCLCLFSEENGGLAALITVGTLLACLVAPLGRFAPPCGYIAADVAVALLFRKTPAFLWTLPAVALGGLLCLLLPRRTADRLFYVFMPSGRSDGVLRRRFFLSGKGRSRLRKSEKYRAVREVCGTCENRMICWVKQYDGTNEIFEKITADRLGKTEICKKICAFCPKASQVAQSFMRERIGGDGCRYSVDFARVALTKEGQTRCGDTSGIFTTPDGKTVLCIADGMGSGAEAADQSERAERLVEAMLKSGVGRMDVLRFLNKTVSDEREKTLGLDLCVIDLADGECEMYKSDAAPTLVVRRGTVYGIGSASLPLGLSSYSEPKKHTCRLCEGDMLVMMSDGLLCEEPKKLAEAVQSVCAEENVPCAAVCESVLAQMRKCPEFNADDRTLIVAKITGG